MKNRSSKRRAFFAAAFLISAVCYAGRGYMIPVEGRSISHNVCDAAGLAWQYVAHWKPLIYKGQPWLKYAVSGYKCVAGKVECTAAECTVAMTQCWLKQAGSWTAVTAAGLPERATGVRIGGAYKPKNCPAKAISGT